MSHSEYNNDDSELRVFQIWITPNVRDIAPEYGNFHATKGDRDNKWLHIVSSYYGSGIVRIHQDANLYANITSNETTFPVKDCRQAYLIQVKGSSIVNGIIMNKSDALESIGEDLVIVPKEKSEFVLIEMAKE
jgi:quercetin 2,3-dioxygenase